MSALPKNMAERILPSPILLNRPARGLFTDKENQSVQFFTVEKNFSQCPPCQFQGSTKGLQLPFFLYEKKCNNPLPAKQTAKLRPDFSDRHATTEHQHIYQRAKIR